MPIHAQDLLNALKRRVSDLEDDLRTEADTREDVAVALREEYVLGKEAGRIGDTFGSWREGVLTQAAVHWVLGGVFVRFLEDNGLIEPMIAGAGERGEAAAERSQAFFRQPGNATKNDRDYLLDVFAAVADLPTGDRLFDRAHNPVWRLPISGDAARGLLQFWRRVDPDTGRLAHDFEDPGWDTRFLGDLYQDLSEAAKKTYALLQTPEFVEAFILDRTLTPALDTFGLAEVRCIDPTCGSGHFLLGTFERLLRLWQAREPGTNERELVQRALDGASGVDLNPFAVAIARFRLLVAALGASGVRRLAQAPAFRLHVATGDSLLMGAVKGQTQFVQGFGTEDAEEAHAVLSQRYHAVVGNPPYITVKDKALGNRYRQLYPSCHRQYGLSVPFTERFWDLAVPGDEDRPAGFVGLINGNAFMKREFGRKLVEDFFPTVDLTHVVDTSGAYIPGHGTPTVIKFGRGRRPFSKTVRAVLGIKGEPGRPDDPARGEVWTAILDQIDRPGSEGEFVGTADLARESFESHPWTLQGGGAVKLLEAIETAAPKVLDDYASSIGFYQDTHADTAFVQPAEMFARLGITEGVRDHVRGDGVRDWSAVGDERIVFPYDDDLDQYPAIPAEPKWAWFYALRADLATRKTFSGQTYEQDGRPWFDYHQFPKDRAASPLSIAYAEITTHNYFALDKSGAVFNRSAPVINLPAGASETDHLGLLGLLNSSVAGFWLKQVCHNKGSQGINEGVKSEAWERFIQANGTKVGQLPIPSEKPLDLARQLDALARERQRRLPAALADALPTPRAEWERNRDQADRLLREMVALQEELDWRCYRLYGVTDDELTYRDAGGQPLTPPAVRLGERAFEIVMARRVAAGDLTTAWFERHGSTPVTEVPARWPADYRALVERRIERIEADRYVGLLERPEYKRRWNVDAWDDQAQDALRGWLQGRLEDARYWLRLELRTVRQLAADAEADGEFMAVAELMQGTAAFDVAGLVKSLVVPEAVPLLPAERYKAPGLRKRAEWEQTWAKQRREDVIDREVADALERKAGETVTLYAERLDKAQRQRKAAEVGAIARPPKYKTSDFVRTDYWRLRGKLDVPKERFVSVPQGSPDTDPSLLVGWAGWTYLEQAQALAARINDAHAREGWAPERLTPLYAGLAELEPWLLQWHNAFDPAMGVGMGDFFRDYLDGELQRQGLTRRDLAAWAPPAKRRRRAKASD